MSHAAGSPVIPFAMLKYFLNRQIGRLEREFGYDATYARELAEAAPLGTLTMFLTNQLVGRPRQIPVEAWFGGQAAAALHADCGPCVQLGVAMATRAGVSPQVMKSLLAGNLEAVSEETRTAFLFVGYALRRLPEADVLREQLVARYGQRAVAKLSFRAAVVHLFPTLKALLGHARTCSRVRVGDETITIRHDTWDAGGHLRPAAA